MRDYANAPEHVKAFYRENHAKQTLAFVLAQKAKYYPLNRMKMGAWEMLQRLDTLKDESDPDTQLSQMQHALQAAEAARRDGQPDWFILAALIHDLGKALCLFGEPQWAVVGDTFPVGCQFSDKNIFPEYFAANPDTAVERYATPHGIYNQWCGLDNVHFSWGHDEYLYQVVRGSLFTSPALAIIRYHSAYAIHSEGAYDGLMTRDYYDLMAWVKKFQPYDLYSKDAAPVNVPAVRSYYQDLIAKYLPPVLCW